MLTINLYKNNLLFKDITKENLKDVLALYNQNERNVYATGIDRQLSTSDINEKYLEVLINSHEFFVGIFINEAETDILRLAGVIKGRLDYDNSEEAWISSILIDNRYQNQGIGKLAADAMIRLLNESYDVKKVSIGILSGNSIGRSFWTKLGFKYIRTIEQYIKLNNHTEDFIIMARIL